jgi:hypothetical protein
LQADIQTEELESIVSLSSNPIENLSLVINEIQHHVDVYQSTPKIVRPFIKRDIPTISSLNEEEFLDLLKNVKDNLESINKTISKIVRNEKSATPKPKSKVKLQEKKIEEPKETREPKVPTPVKKESEAPVKDVPAPPKVVSEEKKIVFCPECGHKCTGKKGLKVHISQVHNEIRDEMLKKYSL